VFLLIKRSKFICHAANMTTSEPDSNSNPSLIL
jgi:hypothetical protein